MRRASTCLAVIGLALLALPGIASAAPTVTFKALAVPISGFPHTGNILGAGTALETEFQISGTEYQGSPPPIIGVNLFLPKGSELHPTGFPTCTNSTLEQFGPIKCPKGSAAGPIGKVVGFVTFGGERVIEEAELKSFYSPGGGIEFFADGHSPVSLEILSNGHYVNLGGAGGFGPEAKVTKCRSSRASPARRTRRSNRSTSSSARRTSRTGRRSTTAAFPRNARRAASRSRPK